MPHTLGKSCTTDSQCAPLKCFGTGPNAFKLANGAAPEGGVCTLPCSATADLCKDMPAGTGCHDFGGNQAFCMRGCSQPDPQKCGMRGDLACGGAQDVFTKTSKPMCLPACSKDASCGAAPEGGTYGCSFQSRLCEPAQLGTPTFGDDCSSTACTNSTCETFPGSEGGTEQSCAAPCHLANLGGCGPVVPTSSGAACLWPEDPANNQAGSQGRCMQLCTCFGFQCTHPGYQCQQFGSFIDSGVVTFLKNQGWDGWCGPSVEPLGGPANTCLPG